ncbi:hypothetical protein Taro_047868, partial [Colocasia esculenta]|nr:hypothetical protein [Colocasia esculenta]
GQNQVVEWVHLESIREKEEAASQETLPESRHKSSLFAADVGSSGVSVSGRRKETIVGLNHFISEAPMDHENMRGTIGKCDGSRNGHPILSPAFNFVVQLPQRLQSCLKSQLKQSMKNEEGANITSTLKVERESDSAWAVNLEKQLQAWKDNPAWQNQPPDIKVLNNFFFLSVRV